MNKKEKPFRFTIDISQESHKKLKALAAIHGKSMREIVIESIDRQIQKLENKQTDITFN